MRHSLVVRIVGTAVLAAGMLVVAPSVGAQTCAYNSTQSTCACPTSGAGTSCFGGQLFRASDNSCQNDLRPCAANQLWSCTTESCVCNTASYPCGGCTAASSTVGATCSAPANGQYTNVCGACACPSGTTICSSTNTCVTTLSCPQGTTFDPCTNTCGTPNVLLSPGWIQSGFIQVNGDVKSTGGNLRMDQATGGGQGDVYIANGKALRVDGSGVTSLSLGNWGTGGTSVNLFQNGNHFAFGISTIPSDSSVASNTIETGQICLGNGINCRTTWPSTTDFNGTYVNVTGDTMSGSLTVNATGQDLVLGGAAGAAGTSKMTITAPSSNEGLRIVSASNWSPLNIRNSTNTADIFRVDQNGNLAVGTVPWSSITSLPTSGSQGYWTRTGTTLSPTTAGDGMLVQGPTSIGPTGIMYSGELLDVTAAGPTTNPLFTVRDNAAGVEMKISRNTILQRGSNLVLDVGVGEGDVDIRTGGTSKIYVERDAAGGQVGIGTTTPAQKLDVNGTAKMTGFQLTTGAAAGRFLQSDASGNGTWSTASIISGTGTANYVPKFTAASTLGNSLIFDNGARVGLGTAAPDAAVKFHVAGGGIGLDNSQSIYFKTSGGIMSNVLWMDGSNKTRIRGLAGGFQVDDSGGNPLVFVDNTGNTGIGVTAPTSKLQVYGGSVLFDGATGAIPATGAGTRFMWYPGKASVRAGVIMTGRTEWDDANIGINSVAFGLNSQASGNYSFANGNNTHSTGDSSTTFGLSTFATNTGAFAAGNGNTASGYSAVALGNNTTASGTHSFAYGSGNQATGDYSTAGGVNSVAGGNGTIAIGWGAHAAGGVGLGDNVYATGSDSVALGFASQATNTSATVSGYQSTGSGFASTAMGYNTTASGYAATAFGQGTTAAGDRSVAMGYNSSANGPGSVALGAYNSTGTTGYATAVGYANSASGQYSFAGGYAATASGDMSFAYGQSPSATGYSSFSLGQYSYSTASYSASYGNFLNTTAYRAMTIGNGYDGTSGGLLANNVGYSIMLGTNSNLPTMTITNGGGVGSTGKVGIATSSPTAKLEVAAGGVGPGIKVSGTSGTWGPSIELDNGSQTWRTSAWSDNTYSVTKVSGTTFTPFKIHNDGYDNELELKSDGISLSGKHAFRSSDSWLRLNQDGAFTSGVHTPGNFAPGALNVGGANSWGNPGSGNAWIAGNLTVYGSIYLGWWRSYWPYISTTTASASLYASSRSWQYVGCPSGYSATGGSAINCEYLSGWGCFQEQLTSSGLYVIVGAGNTASAWVRCIAQN